MINREHFYAILHRYYNDSVGKLLFMYPPIVRAMLWLNHSKRYETYDQANIRGHNAANGGG